MEFTKHEKERGMRCNELAYSHSLWVSQDYKVDLTKYCPIIPHVLADLCSEIIFLMEDHSPLLYHVCNMYVCYGLNIRPLQSWRRDFIPNVAVLRDRTFKRQGLQEWIHSFMDSWINGLMDSCVIMRVELVYKKRKRILS